MAEFHAIHTNIDGYTHPHFNRHADTFPNQHHHSFPICFSDSDKPTYFHQHRNFDTIAYCQRNPYGYINPV